MDNIKPIPAFNVAKNPMEPSKNMQSLVRLHGTCFLAQFVKLVALNPQTK